jgi:hypothetical protein
MLFGRFLALDKLNDVVITILHNPEPVQSSSHPYTMWK